LAIVIVLLRRLDMDATGVAVNCWRDEGAGRAGAARIPAAVLWRNPRRFIALPLLANVQVGTQMSTWDQPVLGRFYRPQKARSQSVHICLRPV